MFGYLDAHRIIACGVRELTHHKELQRLLLKETSAYLGDEDLFQTIYQLIHEMEVFLSEYSYDLSRHRIGHIGWCDNEGYAYGGNAYDIHNTSSFHVFTQFLAYIIKTVHTYLSIKQHSADIIQVLAQGQYQCSIDDLLQEIHAFTNLHQDMENAAHLVGTVCQKYPDDKTRQTTLQDIYKTVYGERKNPILYGIAYNYRPEGRLRRGTKRGILRDFEE
jgi:hypothetical protein